MRGMPGLPVPQRHRVMVHHRPHLLLVPAKGLLRPVRTYRLAQTTQNVLRHLKLRRGSSWGSGSGFGRQQVPILLRRLALVLLRLQAVQPCHSPGSLPACSKPLPFPQPSCSSNHMHLARLVAMCMELAAQLLGRMKDVQDEQAHSQRQVLSIKRQACTLCSMQGRMPARRA